MIGVLEWVMVLFAGVVGGTIGAFARRPTPSKPLEAVCSCGHGSGKHRDDWCSGITTVRQEWNDANGRHRYKDQVLECACGRYDGPDPDTVRMLRGA